MNKTTALQAVNLAAAGTAPFVLQFSGGEPLLAFDLIRKITDYVRRRRIPALVRAGCSGEADNGECALNKAFIEWYQTR
jgi:uncharacterized protein